MDRTRQVTVAADGRTLTFAEWGDLRGVPVFKLHGTPGCRLDRYPNQDLVRQSGARVISYDRPGYGGSDRRKGRTVADCASDIAAIADALGLDRFAVTGSSGGGPHALAVAALLDERVTRVLVTASLAPRGAFGDQWLEGMDPENVKEMEWALQGESVLGPELRRIDATARELAATNPNAVFEAFDLPGSDRIVLAREDRAAILTEVILEESCNGIWGWADDDLAFVEPWGFDPADIGVTTQVIYGTQDVLVPPSHGAWIA